MSLLKIGTLVYTVHNHYVNNNVSGSRIGIARIKTYENRSGEVVPVLKAVGANHEIDPKMHTMYTDLDKAVKALGPQKKSKKK